MEKCVLGIEDNNGWSGGLHPSKGFSELARGIHKPLYTCYIRLTFYALIFSILKLCHGGMDSRRLGFPGTIPVLALCPGKVLRSLNIHVCFNDSDFFFFF